MLETTYELKIFCCEVPKASVIDWLIFHGIDTFVEGYVDDLDIDHEYNLPMTPKYEEVGGDKSPLSIFKFELNLLEELKKSLETDFLDQVKCEIHSSKTKDWVDGWKKNFTPIQTKKLLIVPPWDVKTSKDHQTIIIEPGLAFGTGHHSTTLLCLKILEDIVSPNIVTLLDVGTGTGILSIAASKLGVEKITATDIDPDAITAASFNIGNNGVESVTLNNTDVPADLEFDCVVANILAVVLKKILPQLCAATNPGGQLILSGLLVTDSTEMICAVENLGLSFKKELTDEGWSALLFTRLYRN